MLGTEKKKCSCLTCDFRDLVFTYLTSADFQRVCDNKVEISYSKGQIINIEGDTMVDFKYLKSGLVKLYKRTANGDEQIIAITRPYEFVSNTNVFSEGRYKYSLSALEDSVACTISLDLIKELVENNGRFGLQLLSVLSRTTEKIISQGLDIRSRNLAGRVAYVLSYFSKEVYHSRVFDLPVSRKEVADFISMSTANVIRTFSEFKRDGIIKSYGRTIEIIDADKLEVVSKRG